MAIKIVSYYIEHVPSFVLWRRNFDRLFTPSLASHISLQLKTLKDKQEGQDIKEEKPSQKDTQNSTQKSTRVIWWGQSEAEKEETMAYFLCGYQSECPI